jgi:gliding motility-associated-like protein
MVEINTRLHFTFLFCACILISLSAFSQGTIIAPVKECLGNVTGFSYTPPSGLTLGSATWNFGDNSTSSSNTPVHTYGSIGKFTVVIQATFTNSTTAVDSMKIEVFGVPKAAFYYDVKSDTCFNRNKVCFFDTSRPATSGQTITNRFFVWGDGTFTQTANPGFGQKLCHTYQVNDKYTLRMEMTDKNGCKNSVSTFINIVENIEPDFIFKKQFADCKTAELCVRNESKGANPKTQHYEWYVDNQPVDTLHYLTSFKCMQFTATKSVKVMLVAHANNNCFDTAVNIIPIIVDSLPDTLEILDSVRCFSDESLNEVWFKTDIARDKLEWYFDNARDPFKFAPHIFFITKMNPGMHQVRVNIFRGSCIHPAIVNFRIKGPLGRIRMIDGDQCYGNREVFFLDDSRGIDRKNCIFRWTIDDSLGENCINNRINDINKFKNCNYSTDWFTKHKFSDKVKKKYTVSLYIQDTVNGCSDSIAEFANMKYCSQMLDFDSINVCVDRIFLEDIRPPFPLSYTIDSAKQAWKIFPAIIDSTFKGNYDVGLTFKTILSPWTENFGDDSIKLHNDTMTYYDTVYLKDYLHVKEKKSDSVYVKVYGKCKPFRLSVFFRNGIFLDGESLEVRWGVGNSDYADTFKTTTKIDSISMLVNHSGIQTEIRVEMESSFGCRSIFRLPVETGNFLSKNPIQTTCLNKDTCFFPFVYDMSIGRFWGGNSPNRKVSWWFDDGGTINEFNPCYRFKTGGFHIYRMLTTDSFGCKDTLQSGMFAQDLRAGIGYRSKIAYCSELKKFLDSSSILTNDDDSILKYQWKFGNGTYSSLQKDPVQSLNTALQKIPASHAVESLFGCFDTVDFEIEVIGPKPYFQIRDTIGCGSLNAEFINLSKNCKQYIWQYGDSLQTTFQTFSKANVNFPYNKPGRYFISLVGIDTVFNPFTNSFQNCVSIFPDKVFQKDTMRSVLVLPYKKTGISSRDSICLGTAVSFKSLSDTSYHFDGWYMGDTSAPFKLKAGSSHTYYYTRAGQYDVRLNPGYNTAINNLCRDSARKTIFVMDINADFDIDPNNVPPLFLFHNKSTPAGSALKWNFGQAGSASSAVNDPSHDYGADTGTYNVCLIATTSFGCSDTVCKPIFNDHLEEFGIYNVFTPGVIDDKNDRYDIQIENESLYELLIYDRWGNLVFSGEEDSDNTTDVNWNGKVFNKGAECSSGTYYYIFRYSLKQKPDEVKTINGVIMLIR